MMKYLQRLGKSLMLPVAVLPVASILMGIGYWMDPTGWGANLPVAAFLIKAGGALIDNMGILFAIGVAVGMSDDNDGTAGLAGLVSWLMITTLLAPDVVAMLKGIPVEEVPFAFSKIATQFTGILAGIIGATAYNKFKGVKLPAALSFFSGKRCVAIVTAGMSIVAAGILLVVWPIVFGGLTSFGEAIVGTGATGAGLYGFFNRLLIPTGLHHALNSVFWFDVAGVNDLGNFWAGTGTTGVTGIFMSGYFPIFMFGLPGAALAMYHTAKDNKKKAVYGLLLAAAVGSFFTGVTEPLEFAFMFLAPALYVVHAVLTGISMFVCALLEARAGFNFSAGLVDLVLSFNAPHAVKPLMLVAVGAVFFILYYVIFRFAITKFNLKTPGREDDEVVNEVAGVNGLEKHIKMAEIIVEGLGGKDNIVSVDNCITRVRLEVKNRDIVNDSKIKSSGVSGIIKPGKKGSVQVVVGPEVQFVADEVKKICK